MRSLSRNVIVTLLVWGSCALAARLPAEQQKAVTAHVRIQSESSAKSEKISSVLNAADVVVWLKPVDQTVPFAADLAAKRIAGGAEEQEFSSAFNSRSCGINGRFPES